MSDDWAPELEPAVDIERGATRRVPWSFADVGALRLAALGGVSFVALAGLALVVVGGADDQVADVPAGVAATDVSSGASDVSTGNDTGPTATLAPVVTTPANWSVFELGVDSPAAPDVGRSPGDWVNWSIEVPGPLAAISEPTEVVVVSGRGRVDVFQFPSGAARSTFVAEGADEVGSDEEDDRSPWDRRLLASGELVVVEESGPAAIDPDGGLRELADGELVGVGPRHVAVRRCGDASSCDYVVVDTSTGEEAPAALTILDSYRYVDTSVRIAPDGRSIQFADWRRDVPTWRLIDVATGATTDLGALDGIRIADAWALDSSGVFLGNGEQLRFHSIDGSVGAIVGLGPIQSVATRPVAG